jgi:hypothetical protein
MSDEEKLPSDAEIEGLPEPDTDSEDMPAAEAIPVAEPLAPAPPAAPTGPRIFPQQYTMLFANTLILVGALTVWERSSVTGRPDLLGIVSIGGAFVAAFSAYCVLTGLVSLVRGGVRFGSTLLSGFFAVYFAIKSMVRIMRFDEVTVTGPGGTDLVIAPGFRYFGDFKEQLGTQGAVDALLGQFGPGQYLTLLGGLIIMLMFLKAMFGGKKKAPEPAPRRRR